ncbi:hypothetical protein RAM80_07600 [Pseudomonas sp. App30]|uniref:hypothetical protein n=1 Tax=Pseudomonas sp. App30 TaxID=3068990 RepID=UPI003A8020CD
MGFYWRWAESTLFGTCYNKPFSAAWDAALNRLIDRYWDTAKVGQYFVILGDTKVWIENEFYSYGTQYESGMEFRPSLRTMRRLDSLVRHIKAQRDAEKKAENDRQLEELGR